MRIVWATEGSPNSTRAGGIIPYLRADEDAHLVTLAVIPPNPLPWIDLQEAQTAQQQLERLRHAALEEALIRALERHGLAAHTPSVRIEVGDPARTIARVAAELEADLIVAAPRHATIASEIVGPTTNELLVLAPCPVLIGRETSPWRSVLVATDGSSEAVAAEHAAARVAPPGIPVTALAVEQGGAADAEAIAAESAARLRDAGLEATAETRRGRPAPTIVAAARQLGADAIFVGTHGRTGWRRAMLGSVAQEVARTARSSLVVVPPPRP